MISYLFERYKQLFRPTWSPVDVEDLPSVIREESVYIIGGKHHKWLLAMICPCGCKEVIQLNLLKDASPCWKIKYHKKRKVTLIPSVWRTKGCCSHFRLIKGKIHWC